MQVETAAQAVASLRAAPTGVLLLSPPHAARALGVPWFLAIVAAAAAEVPGVPHVAAFDAGDAPGYALAALRDGAPVVILDPDCPAWAVVASVAAECGAALWPARPPAFAFGRRAPEDPATRAALRAWLLTG